MCIRDRLVPIKNVYAEIGMNIEKINTDTIQTQFGQTTVPVSYTHLCNGSRR